MAVASIHSLRNGADPYTGTSRDDLALTDVVTVNAVQIGTAYQWSLAYIPEGSAAAFSGSVVARSPGTFTVDREGPYLVRLALTAPQITVNAVLTAGSKFTINGVDLTAVAGASTPGSNDFSVGSGTVAGITAEIEAAINDGANSFTGIVTASDASPDVVFSPVVDGVPITITHTWPAADVTVGNLETEQYVRLRALTAYGALKLVAAGERYDTLRVPVDTTFDGWADEQNFNLLALLGLASVTAASTRVLYVDPVNGDYQTIQAAIDYADSQTPSIATQWVVLVRPGVYVEDLTFYPWVNLFGWPGGEQSPLVTVRNATAGLPHLIHLPNPTHSINVVNISFERLVASAVSTLRQTGSGRATFIRCSLRAQGTGVAYQEFAGVAQFFESQIYGGTSTPADYAIHVQNGANILAMHRCSVEGRSGLLLGTQVQAEIRDCSITGSGDFGINTNADSLEVEYCTIQNSTTSVAFNPAPFSGAAGSTDTTIRWSRVGNLTADGTNVFGVGRLDLGSTEHGTITRTNGAVGVATVPADTIFYDNALVAHSRIVNAVEIGGDLTATNVQDALDEIYTYAIGVRTLDDAYDGGVTATGVGRTIVADQGAVQIVDAVAPSDPIPPDNPNGSLEVVGAIKVGGINKPEITVDPNPFGNGPAVHLGREIWANDAPSGSTALILGDATGSPMFHNYNLRVGTQHADGGAPHGVGELFLRAGDSHAAINAGSLYIQAGTATQAGGEGGDIYVVPGGSTLGATEGSIILGRPRTATSATLTANAAMGAGTATAGIIQFGIDSGSFKITLAGGENLAAVHALFNATGVVTTNPADDPIILTTVAAGPTAEVFFLNAGAGVDASIGTFSGQPMVAGTWPDTVKVDATALNEITIGAGGTTGPLVYNAETGKLTVPGMIDPTGMIFSESTLAATTAAVAGWTAGNQGALFVSDGTGGLIDNHLYYVFDTGAALDISGGGTGDVVGPAGVAADNAVVRWDGLTGKLVQDSNAILDDTGNLSLVGSVTAGTEVIITETSVPPSASLTTGRLWVSPGQNPNGLGFVSDNGTLQALPGAWQIAVMHSSQLAIKSSQGVILQATAFFMTAQPNNGDLFTITDGATTRVYGAVAGGDVQYTLGATVSLTLDNLVAAIVADGGAGQPWTALHVGSINFAPATTDGVVIIHRVSQTAASFPDRIFGDANFVTNTVARYMRFDEAPDYRRIGDDSFNDEVLPNADPGAKRFGVGRNQAALFSGDVCISIFDQTVQILDKAVHPDTWSSIGGGGGASLATTLGIGNTSGGTDIQLTTGDEITGQTDVIIRSGGAGDIEFHPTNNVLLQNNKGLAFGTNAGNLSSGLGAGIVYDAGTNLLLVGVSAVPPVAYSGGATAAGLALMSDATNTVTAGAGVNSGSVALSSGATLFTGPGTTAGNTGDARLFSGPTLMDGNTGMALVFSGDAAGGDSGQAQLRSGSASGVSGLALVVTGDAATGASGGAYLNTGSSPTLSGSVNVYSGNALTGASGGVSITTGLGQSTNAVSLTTGAASAGNSGDVLITTGTATGTRGTLHINTRGMEVRESKPASEGVGKAGLFVSDGTGTLPGGVTPIQNALYYLGQPAGRDIRLDLPSLDRHHINMPESGGNTVQYLGWAVLPCRLTKIKVLMSTVNTVGNYTLAITNQAGNTVLNAATFDMNSLGAGAVTTLTLTGALADLDFAVDDKWTIALASSNPGFNGQGIYIDLTFELT